ncbi:MFS transporter [Microbacterium aurantiacum]|uniref:MFS transporter n=1 Tax=Microbacterium aurantiacum TaxID=162393 RepID=UPI00341A5974
MVAARGWRWVFWINIPVGLVALVLAVIAVPHIDRQPARRFDVLGAVLLGVSITALVLAAGWATSGGADLPVIIAAAVVAAVGSLAFVMVELRASAPIVPLRHFANRTVLMSIILSTVIGVGLFSVVSYVPTYIQMAYRTSATVSGLVPIATVFGMLVSTLVTGWLASRSGRYRLFPVIGTALAATGLFVMAALPPGLPLWVPMAAMAVVGIGTGAFMNIIVAVAQSAAAREDTGSVTATVSLVRQIGSTTATAVVGGVIGAGVLAGLPTGIDPALLTPQAMQTASAAVQAEVAALYSAVLAPVFVGLGIAYLVGVVAALLMPPGRLADTLEEPAPALAEGTP